VDVLKCTIYSLDGYDRAIRVVLRTDYDSAVKTAGRVAAALISGGGSGSTPAREVSNRVYVRTRRLPFVDAQGKSRRMPLYRRGEPLRQNLRATEAPAAACQWRAGRVGARAWVATRPKSRPAGPWVAVAFKLGAIGHMRAQGHPNRAQVTVATATGSIGLKT
jgi:hypothetical protein